MKRSTAVPQDKESWRLSVVIPCYNEEQTLATCVQRVLAIANPTLAIELIIVDDASSDSSLAVAHALQQQYAQIIVLHHDQNQGKGAALQTGFRRATGDFVAIQDADLEYDPKDLLRLVEPMQQGVADVVLGSRFISHSPHRVLYFWHSVGNRLLTLLSNMFTDLNLTDMETCYKLFRREVIQQIEIQEKRFGVEPELVAKLAHMRLRIYEMGISYHGRTYQEGKKIGLKDGFRALYCIVRYNAHQAPVALQFLVYLFIGGTAALANLLLFLLFLFSGVPLLASALLAFFLAAGVNYFLSIWILFRHQARWRSWLEWSLYLLSVSLISLFDAGITQWLFQSGFSATYAKSSAIVASLFLNFAARRYLVFPEPTGKSW
ncbi:MAG: bifunctional glycosyltransferase family 2/GtrA family protein [Magnetococcales bacterium]|nr:bifunctional glycosyltransferase family 2/GtrA family protein [Magnetococcales bacterium]MBF0114308.1 bifunctional glycosyltransferase family 2/GtrA family protein [Magnetococcales bacterium]